MGKMRVAVVRKNPQGFVLGIANIIIILLSLERSEDVKKEVERISRGRIHFSTDESDINVEEDFTLLEIFDITEPKLEEKIADIIYDFSYYPFDPFDNKSNKIKVAIMSENNISSLTLPAYRYERIEKEEAIPHIISNLKGI